MRPEAAVTLAANTTRVGGNKSYKCKSQDLHNLRWYLPRNGNKLIRNLAESRQISHDHGYLGKINVERQFYITRKPTFPTESCETSRQN